MENYKSIFTIILIVYIPIDLMISGMNLIPDISLKDSLKFIGYAENLIGIIATLGIAVLLSNKLNNEEAGILKSLQEGMKHWGVVVMANIVTNLMIGLLTILLIVPGVMYGTYWTFLTFIILFSGASGAQAREHSKNLVVGKWWKTFLILCIGWGTTFILSFISAFGFLMLLSAIGVDINTVPVSLEFLGDVLHSLVFDMMSSYFIVVSYVLYVAYESTIETIPSSTTTIEGINPIGGMIEKMR